MCQLRLEAVAVWVRLTSTVTAGRELTSQMLEEYPDLDCIYYSNDDLAAGGAFHCIAAGIVVPDALTLAGFNGLDFIESLPIKIITSRTPRREIGRTAAKLIVDAKEDNTKRKDRIFECNTVIAF